MSELRIHLAEPESVVTPPDVQQALDMWREINSIPTTWASFSSQQFKYERVSNVSWGRVFGNGIKERAIQTITFRLTSTGRIDVVHHTHF